MQDTAVVLGAGGFLGRYICREFHRQGCRVVGVGRKSPERGEADHFILGELKNMDLVGLLREQKPIWVINAAGSASVEKSFVDPFNDWCQTVKLQARILEAFRQNDCQAFYIFLSSAAVYGEPKELPIEESMPCMPISPYGMHKWQAELLQDEYARFFGLRGAILRIFSAYGEGLKKQVVYELQQKILQAEEQLEVFGTGEEARDFIHAIDVAQAVYCVANKKAIGIYNVASGKQMRIADLARLMVEKLRPDLAIAFTGTRKNGDPLKWEADIKKIREIGFKISNEHFEFLC